MTFTKFKLVGRANVFTVTGFYDAAGFIPSVMGETIIAGCRYKTCARIADVEILA
jgi:hypothetical protein